MAPLSIHSNLQKKEHPVPYPYHFLRPQQSGEQNMSQIVHTNPHPMPIPPTMHPALDPYHIQEMQQMNQSMNLAQMGQSVNLVQMGQSLNQGSLYRILSKLQSEKNRLLLPVNRTLFLVDRILLLLIRMLLLVDRILLLGDTMLLLEDRTWIISALL